MKVLYLGTSIDHYKGEGEIIHSPFISIKPRSLDLFSIRSAFADLPEYTHFLFTSKNAAPLFAHALAHFGYPLEALKNKEVIAVGEVTALAFEREGIAVTRIASPSTQEGITSLLALLDLSDAYCFLGGSSKARPYLLHYLCLRQVRHQFCALYDPTPHFAKPYPDLSQIDRVVFTSPSTVEAFFSLYQQIPSHIDFEAIGPITRMALEVRH